MADKLLTTELWARVFYHLSDSRRDISSSRLVCKSFASAATEFLITRVVIAKRSDALQRAWDILEHPVFRLHVKELVYDASIYSSAIATDFALYRNVTSAVPHGGFLRVGLKGSRKSLARLLKRAPQQGNTDKLLPRPQFGPQVPLEIYSGFTEYARRWVDHETIVSNNLHFAALRHALSHLPKLRWVYYTDFRHLARPDESYVELSRRLFGNVLEPACPNLGIVPSICDLLDVLKIIKHEPKARVRGLQIGGHQFELLDEGRCEISPFHHNPYQPPALLFNFVDEVNDLLSDGFGYGMDVEDDDDADGDASKLVPDLSDIVPQNLESLRLPVEVPEAEICEEIFDPDDVPNSSLMKMLRITMPTLVSLEMWAIERYGDISDDEEPGFMSTNQGFQAAILDGLAFASLRSLALGNWRLPQRHIFQAFFARHSSTLREVRLMECKVQEDPRPLGKWIGENMNLAGVQLDVDGWRPERDEADNGEDGGDTAADGDDGKLSADDLSRKGQDDDKTDGESGQESDDESTEDFDSASWWIFEGTPQLEALWLGGRPNHIRGW